MTEQDIEQSTEQNTEQNTEQYQAVTIKGLVYEVPVKPIIKQESLRVGDYVKLLMKKSYGEGYESFVGMVLNFEPFENLPTVVIAYLEDDFTGTDMRFLYLNKKSKEKVEIIKIPPYEVKFKRPDAIERMEKKIIKLQEEIAEMESKIILFKKYFGQALDGVTF
jgi:hypothetical protein